MNERGVMVERGLRREIAAGLLALKPAPPLFRPPEFQYGMPLDANSGVRCGIPEIINEQGPSFCLCVLYLCQLATCEYVAQAFSGRPERSSSAKRNL